MSNESTRTGVLARKVGMSRLFDASGKHVPVTVLCLDDCRVVGHKTDERDGYTAVILGAGVRRDKRVTKPMKGVFAAAKVQPAKHVAEFRVDAEALIEVGAHMQADHFVEGQLVDTRARSVGKGFAGAMKRHNFGGLRASHGVSISHRSHGSTGQCQDPGKVFKGKKMAGHMGHRICSEQNLVVVRSDVDRGLILVRGAVPGPKGSWVEVRDAVKRSRPETAPKIGSFRSVSDMLDGSSRSDESADTESSESV